jgi:prepilin-type N-terminal cleavage/methylation domain-containing protein
LIYSGFYDILVDRARLKCKVHTCTLWGKNTCVKKMMNFKSSKGFTLVELLTVTAIIAILASLGLVFLNSAKVKARDVKRKAELNQFGRFLVQSCYVPDLRGPDEYDLHELIDELTVKYPQYANAISNKPQDPKTGSEAVSNYTYIVTADKDCALYANLENDDEPVSLPALTEPTAGGGSGVLDAGSNGVNGSSKYLQYSNQ